MMGARSSPRRPTPPLTRSGRGTRRRPRAGRAHSPVVPPAWARAMVASMMLPPGPSSSATSAQHVQRLLHRPLVPLGPPTLHIGDLLRLDPVVDLHDVVDLSVTGERGGAVSVKQLTPTTRCSPVSMRRTRSAWLRTRRILSSSMASKAPPRASTSASSASAASMPARPSWPQ
jgi:hypothetical protein